jgi:exopolysaccharide biosynthesis polyprenyl glycosylphosphotransferase
VSISYKEWPLLVFGDLLTLAGALYLTLLVRYIEVPSLHILILHFQPFALLATVWLVVFVISGLYEKHTTILRSRLPAIVVRAQFANVIIAAIFFFFIPYFGITPKTNLVIFLVISSILLIFWRLHIYARFNIRKRNKAIILGTKKETEELYEEVNKNPRYNIRFCHMIDLHGGNPNDIQQTVLRYVEVEKISIIVANLHDRDLELITPLLYNLSLVQGKIDIVDMASLYEDIFERVPTSLISNEWLVENLTSDQNLAYTIFKRVIDINGALVLGLFSLIFYPFVWIAIKLDDGGPLFVRQERVGKQHQAINIIKFRTMSGIKSDTGVEVLKSKKVVTRVGTFLRNSRIDELPQLWSVLKGDQSLIGPRPELPALVDEYSNKIPHYAARHLVKPGLSGWAQIHHQAHPHHGTDIQETKIKLAYDFYYIKHRSIILDIMIALRTIEILLSRLGK